VEAWFTGAGALVAVVALAVSEAVARRQTRIQERLAAIEEARRRERSRHGVGRRSQPPYGRTSGTIGVGTFAWC